ncbi:hypothetical protein L7F22_019854 [Adiantum nelumboides]|nr:hypothetical protein [Adiantum nelumboides]
MASLVRLVPRTARRHVTAFAACQSPSASTSAQRMMHASPALDPVTHTPAATIENVVENAQTTSPDQINESLVHVRINYLHPSTKKRRSNPEYIPLSSHVFNTAPRRDILHSAVVYYLDGLRQGTASTKTRGEVAFSGKKILPQKGTGKARRGTRGSPLLRKGGVAHGPKPRDFSTKLNRRVRELALRSALSLRWRMGDLHVVKNLYWQPPPQSTGPLRQQLKSKGWDDALFLTAPREPRPALQLGKTGKFSAVDPIYTEEQDLNHGKEVQSFAIACGNIPRIEMINLADLTLDAHEKAKKKEDLKRPGELHAYEVLARKKLICDLGAIEWLEEKLGGSLFHENGFQQFALEDLQSEDLIDEVSSDGVVDDMSAQLNRSLSLGEAEMEEDAELTAAEDQAIKEETERVLQDIEAEKKEKA